MEILNNTVYAVETERADHEKTLLQNNTLHIECAQRAHLYKSIWIVRSTDSYFNAHQ